MKERVIKVIQYISIIFAIGLSYAGICNYTGFGIPCIFREITGYKCAGCGITHMFLALLRLDVKAAFRENQFALILLPEFGIAVMYHIYQYIKYDRMKVSELENKMCYVLIPALIVWGIVRNMY